MRSFASSDLNSLGLRDFDYPIFVEELSTHQELVIITSKGNYIHIPVHELPEIKWKDLGVHLSQNYQLQDGERFVKAFVANQKDHKLILATKAGMIKQTPLSAFTTYRSYKTRTAKAMNLVDDQDEVVAAECLKTGQNYEVVLLTKRSYCLRYSAGLVSEMGHYEIGRASCRERV